MPYSSTIHIVQFIVTTFSGISLVIELKFEQPSINTQKLMSDVKRVLKKGFSQYNDVFSRRFAVRYAKLDVGTLN